MQWTSHAAFQPTDERGRETFASWLQVAPAMLHCVDESGRFVAVTDFWLTKLGYSRDEIIGTNASELLTPDSRERASKVVFPELLRTGRVSDVHYQVICKDKTILDMMLSSVMVDNMFTNRRETISVLTDVTDLKRAERLISESEDLYRTLIENQTELVSLATPDGRLLFVNKAYASQYGLTQADLIGRNLYDFAPPEIHTEIAEHFKRVIASRKTIKSENQIIQPDGTRRWFSWSNTAILDRSGAVMAVHSVGRDIEERVLAEARLRESEARYRLLADHSTDMVFQLDRNLVRRYVSPACREILGYEPDEMIGRAPSTVLHPEDADHVRAVFEQLLDGTMERSTIINRTRHRSGHWVWVEAHVRHIKEPGAAQPSGIIGTLRDITARKLVEDQLAEASRQLQSLALLDALTGIDNRRSFDVSLDREVRRANRETRPLALLMIDVDWFKAYNDHYGHPEGDECLKQIAAAISQSIRRPGDFVSRYGGEEFAVILTDTDGNGALEVATKIRQSVERLTLRHEKSDYPTVTVSIGLVVKPANDKDLSPTQLIKRADLALYDAKKCGRNLIKRYSEIESGC